MWPQLSSSLEHFFLFLSLLLLSWCAWDLAAHIRVASASEVASHLARPVTVSASCVPRTRLALADPVSLLGLLLTDMRHRWAPLSPRGSARAVCCWLRNAWGLLAPNDLLSVSAVRPPSTQSCMRAEAPGEAQWCTAPPTTRFGWRTRVTK